MDGSFDKMTQELDYNNESVLEILNNAGYTEEEKKQLFEKYKSDLKKARKDKIVSIVNQYALEIPVITKEIYIDFLKRYENDDLTKPFEVIEEELKEFKDEMNSKYEDYKSKQGIKEEKTDDEILPDVTPEEELSIEEEFDDTIFKDPDDFNLDDNNLDYTTPSLFISDEISVLNEEPELLAKPLNSNEEEQEVMPGELKEPLGEKGNASAIILSIIAIIIGAVIMYSIIRLK